MQQSNSDFFNDADLEDALDEAQASTSVEIDMLLSERRVRDAVVENGASNPVPVKPSIAEFATKILTALEKRKKMVPIVYPVELGGLSADWEIGAKYLTVRFDDGFVTGSYIDADTYVKHVFITDAFDTEEYIAQLCTIAGFVKEGHRVYRN